MGCCLSTTKTPKSNNPNTIPSTHHRRSPESDPKDRAPPPPPAAFEEETVKEVLSETPIAKLPTPAVTENNETRKRIEVHEVRVEPTAVIKPSDEIVSEISEVSEMFSFTESFSTTMTEKRDEADSEVTQRTTQRIQSSPVKIPKKRPYTGEYAGVRERGVRSPARRSAPSPEKRSHTSHVTSRSVPGRPVTNQRRVVGSPNGGRRDPGEGSARRSRSPVTRGDGGPRQNVRYRSPTATTSTSRAGGKSPARTVEYGSSASPVRTVENGSSASPVRTVEYGSSSEKGNDGVSQQTSESLENPLVSLECFIFL